MKPVPSPNSISCDDIREVFPNISTKWSADILALLKERPRRFSEMKRELRNITQKSLTATLRELEKDGLVKRTVTPVIPPRVDYELTQLGRSLLEPVLALALWAFENGDEVRAARERFKEAN